MKEVKATWIAADWGTTHMRAWSIDANDNVLAYSESDEGMKDLDQNEFEIKLLSLIEAWIDDDKITPVMACGMVGAKQGWVETPYQQTPCLPFNINQLTSANTEDRRIQVNLIPGVMQQEPADIMRGEETQISGFLKTNPSFDGMVCLPGTHAKWVKVGEGKIERFTTFMTGELFGVISKNTLISHSFKEDGWHQSSFEKGLRSGFESPSLIAAELFSLRAESILNDLDCDSVRARLSDLLIGLELHGTQTYWRDNNVVFIGSENLTENYLSALKMVGGTGDYYNVETATLAGLSSAYNELLSI